MSLETISAGENRSIPGHAVVRGLRALAVRFRIKTAFVPERQGASRIPARTISQSELNAHLHRDIGLAAVTDSSVWRALR